jgi:hypothetical protein
MKKLIIASVAAILALTACVKDIVYPYATFSKLENTIAYDETEAVTVTVNVSALVNIEAINLVYTVNDGEPVTVEMHPQGKGYFATIPAQAMDAVVNYYIEAITANATSTSAIASYTVGVIPIDFSGLKINELNGNDKFIELVNTGSSDIIMKGVTIVKDASKTIWTGTEDVVVKAGKYLLLYSDNVTGSGGAQEGYPTELVFSGGLSASKPVRVQLFDPKGNSLDDFNLLTLLKSKAPASYGCNADGKWYYQDATPGAKNIDGTDVVFE